MKNIITKNAAKAALEAEKNKLAKVQNMTIR